MQFCLNEATDETSLKFLNHRLLVLVSEVAQGGYNLGNVWIGIIFQLTPKQRGLLTWLTMPTL
jgi:hypothetical protein